jgi:hypothetical protein
VVPTDTLVVVVVEEMSTATLEVVVATAAVADMEEVAVVIACLNLVQVFKSKIGVRNLSRNLMVEDRS